ncbi:hypothetical protein IU436_16515 [Nocardia farcinica]|uniref:hypothetical protein n=1 Tax=Nocardia farcinica TaxID=37329 RepID=UPI0018962C0A|nr:hypothetical protein [Nocardia farcinica]MBF6258688.1 hypothetical protein [Nocardia farcinica]MBF6420719.1 hypothetical protein [Nocardia farcinica]MBF6431963.1 hypothetical protein [Nocardia farcinica]MBF6502673.1 hypothetical protein [Nocardia farcinica]
MTDTGNPYATLAAALCAQPVLSPPALVAAPAVPGRVTLGELVDADALSVHEAPLMTGGDAGDTPVLSAKDVRLNRPPSRRGSATATGAVWVRRDDVALAFGPRSAVRVCREGGVLLGAGIHLIRGRVETLDPRFLACVLRAAGDAADGGPFDLYQVEIPRLPLAHQRELGAAFEQLVELESSWRRRRASIEQVVRAGIGGLAAGTLCPGPAEPVGG